LQEIIDHCSNKEGIEFTPSDFDSVDLLQEEIDNIFN
jgi:hypothetical protein